jgi:hypothetical protein
MGNIMIHVPQHIHIEYTLENGLLTKRLLDLLNTMMLQNKPQDDEYDSLLGLFADQSELLDQVTEFAMHARETDTLQVQ